MNIPTPMSRITNPHSLISMTDIRKYIFLICVLFGISIGMNAQEDLPRPVTSVYRVEGGAANARSTYLSPLRYSGSIWGLSGEWQKAFQKNPDHTVMTFAASVNYRNMLNPAHTARMLGFDAMFNWGMAYRLRLPYNLQLLAGGLLDINGGALYLTRNGNNPVTALAYAGFDIDGALSWRSRIGRIPIIVTESLRIPTIGAFFSPAYGETYYEIFLGNHAGLAHCGWWGNHFGLSNYIYLRLDFGRTAMEIGYRYDYRSAYASHLVTRTAANTFVIGIIPHGLGLKNKRKANYADY